MKSKWPLWGLCLLSTVLCLLCNASGQVQIEGGKCSVGSNGTAHVNPHDLVLQTDPLLELQHGGERVKTRVKHSSREENLQEYQLQRQQVLAKSRGRLIVRRNIASRSGTKEELLSYTVTIEEKIDAIEEMLKTATVGLSYSDMVRQKLESYKRKVVLIRSQAQKMDFSADRQKSILSLMWNELEKDMGDLHKIEGFFKKNVATSTERESVISTTVSSNNGNDRNGESNELLSYAASVGEKINVIREGLKTSTLNRSYIEMVIPKLESFTRKVTAIINQLKILDLRDDHQYSILPLMSEELDKAVGELDQIESFVGENQKSVATSTERKSMSSTLIVTTVSSKTANDRNGERNDLFLYAKSVEEKINVIRKGLKASTLDHTYIQMVMPKLESFERKLTAITKQLNILDLSDDQQYSILPLCTRLVDDLNAEIDEFELNLMADMMATPLASYFGDVEEVMPLETPMRSMVTEEIEAIRPLHHKMEKVPEETPDETMSTAEKAKMIFPILITIGCFATFACVARICYFRWKKKNEALHVSLRKKEDIFPKLESGNVTCLSCSSKHTDLGYRHSQRFKTQQAMLLSKTSIDLNGSNIVTSPLSANCMNSKQGNL